MIELFDRWLSIATIIGLRANGKVQALQPSIGGTKSPPAPSGNDLSERRELTTGMLRWLERSGVRGEDPVEMMHAAITAANPTERQRLLAIIERAEWLLKEVWEDGRHRHMKAREADRYGREAQEQTLVMRYRGVRTRDAAEDASLTYGQLRWIRRKHGLSNTGERMYPCTIAPMESCSVCSEINTYSDDYDSQEAA